MKRSKHGLFVFPLNKTLIMEKALFHWPVVFQYEVKAKHGLISRKFSGMKFFYPSVRLTKQKPRAFVSNQIALFPFVCCFCFARAFSFQGQTKIALFQPHTIEPQYVHSIYYNLTVRVLQTSNNIPTQIIIICMTTYTCSICIHLRMALEPLLYHLIHQISKYPGE